jgi:hypothetical protein
MNPNSEKPKRKLLSGNLFPAKQLTVNCLAGNKFPDSYANLLYTPTTKYSHIIADIPEK